MSPKTAPDLTSASLTNIPDVSTSSGLDSSKVNYDSLMREQADLLENSLRRDSALLVKADKPDTEASEDLDGGAPATDEPAAEPKAAEPFEAAAETGAEANPPAPEAGTETAPEAESGVETAPEEDLSAAGETVETATGEEWRTDGKLSWGKFFSNTASDIGSFFTAPFTNGWSGIGKLAVGIAAVAAVTVAAPAVAAFALGAVGVSLAAGGIGAAIVAAAVPATFGALMVGGISAGAIGAYTKYQEANRTGNWDRFETEGAFDVALGTVSAIPIIGRVLGKIPVVGAVGTAVATRAGTFLRNQGQVGTALADAGAGISKATEKMVPTKKGIVSVAKGTVRRPINMVKGAAEGGYKGFTKKADVPAGNPVVEGAPLVDDAIKVADDIVEAPKLKSADEIADLLDPKPKDLKPGSDIGDWL